jgi:hypothetical protein
MNHMQKAITLFTVFLVSGSQFLFSQAGAGMKLGPKNEQYLDSIKNSDYRWKLPIWGKKLSKKGFDLQCPFGIMVNPYVGSQKINITDLKVGFNGNEPVPLDFVKFGEVTAKITSVTIRPDVWILPFLDLYGIAGATWTETNVSIAEPIQFNTKANFSRNTFGIGATLAGGFHGLIVITDINHTWSHLDKIEGAGQVTMVSPRIGKNFVSTNHPDRNIAFWEGAPGIWRGR